MVLSSEELNTLEAWIAARNTPQKVAFRSRIVLMAAENTSNRAIARRLGTTRDTVIVWRRRFVLGRTAALTAEMPGRGRKPRITPERIQAIVNTPLHTQPVVATHWTVRTMTLAQQVRPATVQRIWGAYGLQPHRVKTFKLSRDKHFVENLTDVVGLYLNPPDKTLLLCVDEKSQIQALDRTQPGLPVKRGRCGTFTHDYKRHGTTRRPYSRPSTFWTAR